MRRDFQYINEKLIETFCSFLLEQCLACLLVLLELAEGLCQLYVLDVAPLGFFDKVEILARNAGDFDFGEREGGPGSDILIFLTCGSQEFGGRFLLDPDQQ